MESPVSDTPVFDQLMRELAFSQKPGRFFTEDREPPHDEQLILENVHNQRIYWSGKRWCEDGYQNSESGGQMFDAWPPYAYGPVLWREVSDG